VSGEDTSIVGSWDVSIDTPMGAQVVSLEFADQHSGVARFGNQSVELQNVSVSGDTATCSVAVTEPMSITLRCRVQVVGDELSGVAGAGFFGRFAMTGRRTSQ
jgi:hypothetical protein